MPENIGMIPENVIIKTRNFKSKFLYPRKYFKVRVKEYIVIGHFKIHMSFKDCFLFQGKFK